MKQYKVVVPDLINPDDPMGLQEPMDNSEIRDLVNVEDDTDRFMANHEDFDKEGEIVSEDAFKLIDASYIDEQGNLGTAPFAFRN